MESILQEIAIERVRQDKKWGGAEHDDTHRFPDFVRWIKNYVSWSNQKADGMSWNEARHRMVQVAALAVAAIEWIDRNRNSQSNLVSR